ncbi:MAG: sialidase family protein [Candidatus Methanoperedens sp.]|nr:sialidase family protein [Candidatus Methanoperedens sp.]
MINSVTGITSAKWNEPYFILSDSDRPSIIQDKDGIYWIAFNSYTNPQNIWIMNSNDSINWMNFYQVTVSNLTDYEPNLIQDKKGRFWIVYSSLIEIKGTLNFNYDLKLVYSDNGINWSNPVNITNSPLIESYPYIMQDNKGRFFITYSTYSNESINDLDIYVKYSDDGLKWSEPMRITDSLESDIFPIMIQDNSGKYWMLFSRNTHLRHKPLLNKYDLFLIYSEDGIRWSNVAEITNLSYNVNYPYFMQDKNGIFWIPHMTGITGSEELGIMGSLNGTEWTDSEVLSNYSKEGYFKTDYKSMIQDRNGSFIYAFTSAKIGRGIWLMNGTQDSDFSKTRTIEFNINRISQENDKKNFISTISNNEKHESGMEFGIFTLSIILISVALRKS